MRLKLLAATVALVAATPAPVMAQDREYTFASAISATIHQHLTRRGLQARFNEINNKIPSVLQPIAGSASGSWATWIFQVGKKYGWFPMRPFFGYPAVNPTEGYCFQQWCFDDGDFTDGAIPGMIGDQECDELIFSVDASGNPMVPSIPLSGGTAIIKDQNTYYTTKDHPFDYRTAAQSDAIALWWLHRSNIGRPKEQWAAAYTTIDATSGSPDYMWSRPAYRDLVSGAIIAREDGRIDTYYNQHHWREAGGTSLPCPIDGGGSDFDFYGYSSKANEGDTVTDHQDECTWYTKNFSLSASGYGYPETVSIPNTTTAMQDYFWHHYAANKCRLSPELIRVTADIILRNILAYHVTDVPYEPILTEDVAHGGHHPLGNTLINENPPESGTTGFPIGTPSPANGGTAPTGYVPPDRGPDGGYPTGDNTNGGVAIDLEHPDNPTPDFEAPEIGLPDFLPDLPSFNVPTGSGQCPVFGFNAFGQSFVMDGHCQLIEPNRSLIATIMLIFFSLGSFAVILRA